MTSTSLLEAIQDRPAYPMPQMAAILSYASQASLIFLNLGGTP